MANGTDDLLRQYYEMLMDSQFWPAEQMLAHQRTQLGHLLRHARAQSPFYEHRLDAVFRLNGDIDWDRWGEIPILKRSDLLDHREGMLARELPRGHGPTREFTTSGSTGAPVTITITKISDLATRASGWRSHSWHDVDWSQNLLSWMGETEATHWPHGRLVGRWGPYWEPAALGDHFSISRTTPPEKVLEFAQRRDVGYLTGRPKSMQYLALDALSRAVRVPLGGIFCFGTGVAADEREDCLAAFGAEIWAHYSSKEMSLMAHQCPTGAHLHINAETVFIEIIDEHGRPAAPGEMGRVIVTALYSTGQPLIRYEQGDQAIVGGPCPCGRHLPTLERVVGRVTNLFRLPDGRKIALSIPDHYRSLLGANYWQIAQIGPLAFEVRYVPSTERAPDEASFAELVKQHVRRADIDVSFSRRETLHLSDGGKFIQYVCELTP